MHIGMRFANCLFRGIGLLCSKQVWQIGNITRIKGSIWNSVALVKWLQQERAQDVGLELFKHFQRAGTAPYVILRDERKNVAVSFAWVA